MTIADAHHAEVRRTIDAVWRIESARLIAGLARMLRDVGLAEELAQDALVIALEKWPQTGVPDNPGAWLMATAKHRAIDRLRRSKLQQRKHEELGHELEREWEDATAKLEAAMDDDIGDDLLRLVITSCHPLLSMEARVALTLRLLGGLTTFALLLWMAWRAIDRPITLVEAGALKRWVIVGVVLLGLQIALGGWTSANYAALSCGAGSWSADNFPKCVGQWWPPHDFREGFVLWRGVGVDYEGGVLDGASRIAIQMVHRIVAVLLALYLLVFAARLLRTPGMRGWATALIVLVISQVSLGILNVKLALPLHVAVAHNAGAALLLFVLVSLLARLRRPE